jgi:bacillithiol biosynthesis cysteine-adding enzyme BshC
VTSSFSASWLRGEPRALEFLPDRYRHREARAEAVAAAASRTPPPALLAVLAHRNARLAPSPTRERNLELLGRPGTVAVVTGQQVGLFLGPLYTVYKAASAIVAARALTEETGRPCVPIFWLQTEDHDLPEIDHCVVPRPTGEQLRVALNLPDAATSRVPVAHRLLGAGVTSALAEVREALGGQPHGAEFLELLERAYRPEATLPQAFVEVLSTVFAEEGLVFLDPRDARLAPLAAPLHRRALEDAAAISSALARRSAALTEAGFSEQVHIRPGAPLGFFSPDGDEGARYRLAPGEAPDTWTVAGHPEGLTVTTAELLGWLEREPRRFTTSALLRPLLQDTWLPTAAYVGGPGEVAYFAQLAPLYVHLGLPMPLVVPRARFRVIEERTRSLLEKLGLTPDELAAPRDEVLARLAARSSGEGFEPPEAAEARLTGPLTEELARLGERLKTLDPTLASPLRRTEKTVQRAVTKLMSKYRRALARRDQVASERLDRVRGALAPDGAPQERIHGLPYYACRFGTRDFTRRVLDACVPFSGALKDLTP